MGKQIFIGLATEGDTDIRFLESIVHRTFEDIALQEYITDIEIYVHTLHTSKLGLDFPEFVVNASKDGIEGYGIMTLAIHTDADRDSYEERISNKIVPAQNALNGLDENYCKILTPIIPIHTIEAWMLADKALFKDQIGTTKSDRELGIDKEPEAFSKPKHIVEEAIRIATDHQLKRRHRMSIGELYGMIGDSISIESLSRLNSYRKFQDAVRDTYRNLHYLP